MPVKPVKVRQIHTTYGKSVKVGKYANALVLHIACDPVPISRLDSQHFRCFVSDLDQCYQFASRKTWSTHIACNDRYILLHVA